jgi:hypothetical protein
MHFMKAYGGARELLLDLLSTLDGVARLHSRPNRFTLKKTIPDVHLAADWVDLRRDLSTFENRKISCRKF